MFNNKLLCQTPGQLSYMSDKFDGPSSKALAPVLCPLVEMGLEGTVVASE